MDDWQDHALSTRHMHNRNSRRPSGKGKKGGQFDVRKTFGEYEVKCASWERALGELEDEDRRDDDAAFELLRLTDDGQGVLGELVLPGVLRAAVVLAATRRGLMLLTRSLAGEEDEEGGSGSEGEDEGREGGSDGEDQDSEERGGDENHPPTRFDTFEKNSFRSPKFWLAWNGSLTSESISTSTSTTSHPDSPPPSSSSTTSPPPSPTLHRTGSSLPPSKPKTYPSPASHFPASGQGYIVFTTSDCRKFKGTLSCKELGWKDVAFSGFKSVSRSESDRQLLWGGRDVETGWREGAEGEEKGERGARVDARRRVVFD